MNDDNEDIDEDEGCSITPRRPSQAKLDTLEGDERDDDCDDAEIVKATTFDSLEDVTDMLAQRVREEDLLSKDDELEYERQTYAAWQLRYVQFLSSAAWQRMRVELFARALGQCERCNTNPAQQAHHECYQEPFETQCLDDLRALCVDCHEARHEEMRALDHQHPLHRTELLAKLFRKDVGSNDD